MQKIKDKTLTILIATFLTITIGTSMILIPTANAHTLHGKFQPTLTSKQSLILLVSVRQLTSTCGLTRLLAQIQAMTNDWRFHNYKLTITAPEGTTETKTWETVWDTTSSPSYSYTPNQVGTYTLKFTGLQEITVPAGTYKTFSIEVSSSKLNVHADDGSLIKIPGNMTLQLSGITYLEVGTCCLIKANLTQESAVQTTGINNTSVIYTEKTLVEHTKP